ncbi:PilZ domain-containing protein [Thalassotalea sp. G2M2-11]|uniref:PilZ domain-containing protein n=1 Tax=Thalassotalea sp. G2M2-11 TaxID=2787627 RepID=UPI0019D2C93C|nr:PilZ domain-containing protein [Thalassotalea sp. G2M2-11]
MVEDNQDDQDYTERRRAFRLDMEKELVDIVWHNDQGQEIKKKIVCVDFSKGGLKLDCDQAIPLNTDVKVVFQGAAPQSQELPGRVIRCIQQPNGWFEVALSLSS